MFFIGQAANYRPRDILRHSFTIGRPSDSVRLRRHLAMRYGVNPSDVALYHTGRSALTAALQSTLPRQSKVVVVGFTCHAVLKAVKAARCIPIFADIQPETLHYDAKTLRQLIQKHPDIKAIVVQNTLGITVDISSFEKVKQQYKLTLIEDLAHCTGRLYPDGREVGTVGDVLALSFGKGKSIDTISGGAVVLRCSILNKLKQPRQLPSFSDRLRDRCYPFLGLCIRAAYHLKFGKIITAGLLKVHLIQRSADAVLDTKIRLTHWQARLALRQLQKLTRTKQPLRQFYLLQDRDQALAQLQKIGYHFNEIWYEVPVSPARYYKKLHFPEADCPNSVKVASQIINFPTHYSTQQLQPASQIIQEYLIK